MKLNENEILKEIINYYKINKTMPSIRYLQKKFNVNSPNAIYYHLKKLEKKEYIKRNEVNERILCNNYNEYENGLKKINVINSNEKVQIIINNEKDYLAFKVNNNYLKNDGIIKNDLVIIVKTKKLKNNDIGLFKINKKYYIMKYYFQDNFYILESDVKRYYDHVNIIGKVEYLERKIKRD